MLFATQVTYQSYVAGARGALKTGVTITSRSADEGLRCAEHALAGGSVIGTRVRV